MTPTKPPLLVLLLVAQAAHARVGGGQEHGEGGGGWGGDGGFGGGDDVVGLLIRLAMDNPHLALIAAVAFGVWVVVKARRAPPPPRRAPGPSRGDAERAYARRAWASLAEEDPALSEPVFQDLVQLVVRRALEAATTGDWAPLAPYVVDDARAGLLAGHEGVTAIHDVVLASSPIVAVRRVGGFDEVDVDVTSSRDQAGPGPERRMLVEERWTFRRRVGARSLPPDAVRRLGCPSCGAAVQTDPMGRCARCGTPVTAGQLQWQASAVQVRLERPLGPPDVAPGEGGEEASFHAPSVEAPSLDAQRAALLRRHPELDLDDFQRRVDHVFLALQAAWDALRWQDARPWCTDAAWHQLGFFIDRYRRAGLRNHVQGVRPLRARIVRIGADAFYEAITVRLWAAARDWTEDADGRVVGGCREADRWFSEYWTFLRAVGAHGPSRDPATCPSCGAPLDRINAAGVCGYCDSVVTTGEHDWVLSRIEQAEDYRG